MIMNAQAGSIGTAQADERADAIRAAFAEAGVAIELYAVEGSGLTAAARAAAAAGFEAVIAAGGDGTVNAVASALVDGKIPLGVLPLGTLNHFARDLGLPGDLAGAARAIAAGRTGLVDVGEVNGRIFVNNSSIGIYPELVLRREAEQRRRGIGKWRAFAIAAWRVLRRFPMVAVHLVTGEATVLDRTPFLFVGNNPYRIAARALGTRDRLDGGHLAVYLVRARSRLKMLWLMARAIVQRVESVGDLEALEVTEARVALPRRPVPVALDGEVVRMASPLRYRIRPRALPVLRAPEPT